MGEMEEDSVSGFLDGHDSNGTGAVAMADPRMSWRRC